MDDGFCFRRVVFRNMRCGECRCFGCVPLKGFGCGGLVGSCPGPLVEKHDREDGKY